VPAIVDDRGAVPAATLLAHVSDEMRWLAATGARRVGLLADNGRAWAVTDLALLAGRRINVPLPRHFGQAQIRHLLDSAGVDAVLTDAPHRILELGLRFAHRALSPRTNLALLTRPAVPPGAGAVPSGTAKLTFTSGSTADPKGVCLTAVTMETVACAVAAIAKPLGITRHLALLPLPTLLENIAGLYASLLAGATCHLPSAPARAIADGTLLPPALLAALDAHRPESLILVPELLRLLVGAAEGSWRPPGAAKFYAVGGARVSCTLLERAAAAGLPVFEGYGLSECASVVCLNTPAAARRGSVGRPLSHARLRVDEQGEIHVGGAVMCGYVGAPNPRTPAEIATGDIGAVDSEGFVHISGRRKSLIINSYGRNLSPEWIESELAQEPVVGQAVVFGEARPSIVALIVPIHAGVSAKAIAEGVSRANARLPAYARVAGHHVVTERFSPANGLLTANGRPRREKVLERYADTIERLHADAASRPAQIAHG
jgi:long-subunit acyl-CoA synthetase (AMP-forming)